MDTKKAREEDEARFNTLLSLLKVAVNSYTNLIRPDFSSVIFQKIKRAVYLNFGAICHFDFGSWFLRFLNVTNDIVTSRNVVESIFFNELTPIYRLKHPDSSLRTQSKTQKLSFILFFFNNFNN